MKLLLKLNVLYDKKSDGFPGLKKFFLLIPPQIPSFSRFAASGVMGLRRVKERETVDGECYSCPFD